MALLAATEAAFRAQADHVDFRRAAATRAATAALVRDLAARRAYGAGFPRVLIHGDFVGNNVLVEEDRVVAILDFDRLAEGDRVFEVARTPMYVASRVDHPGRGDGATADGLSGRGLAAVAELLAGYTAASAWPLTPAELRALPFEMAGAPRWRRR